MDFDDKKREVRQMIVNAEGTRNWERVDRLERGLLLASTFYLFNKIGAHMILNRLLAHTDRYGCAPVDWLEAKTKR